MAGMLTPSYLGTPTDKLGKTFKTFDWNSDGIGNTMLDFMRSRPDLFQGIEVPSERKRFAGQADESGNAEMFNSYGAADDLLKNYKVERRGAAGQKDGRSDVVVDTRTGQVVYSGSPYTYDPAKKELKEAATFIGGAIAGYFGVNALAGMTGGAGGAAAGGGSSAGTASTAGAAAGGSGASSAVSGLGIDAAGNLVGSSLMDGALANTFAGAGSLAPGGVGALIPSGGALGAGGSLLTGGGMLTGGVGSATGGLGSVASAASQAKSAAGGIFDKVLSGAKDAFGAVDSLFESSKLARNLLNMVGAGVMQMSAEKAAKKGMEFQAKERQKERDWQDKKEADTRRRQMPAGGGMLGRARVIKGGSNGG